MLSPLFNFISREEMTGAHEQEGKVSKWFYRFYWPEMANTLNFLLTTPQQKGVTLKDEQ